MSKEEIAMDKIYFIIPAYNEEETIKSVVEEWYQVVEKLIQQGADPESKLVIINDGSKDNTYKVMQELAESRPHFQPVTKPNGGHGATVLYGYKMAIEAGADYIFQTDSDGQTIPDEFYQFWNIRNQYDLVIGARTHREDGISRIIVTKFLKAVIWMFFHAGVRDANTPFRLVKVDTLKKYIHLIPDDFNLSNVIMTVIFTKKNTKIKYIPITFRPRQGGVNSINIPKIIKIGEKAVADFIQINKTIDQDERTSSNE